jgi:ribosomal protein S18 acetylase RimI-like enzyme
MTDAPAIRAATPDDVAAVERVVESAYALYVERIGKKPGPMLDDYAARIAEGAVSVLLDAGAVVGVLVLLPEPDHLLLDNVAVLPSQAGRGLGRRLMNFAEAEARRRGYDEIRLYTHALMHENLALYPRLGYVEYARAAQAGYDRVFMRKRIARS